MSIYVAYYYTTESIVFLRGYFKLSENASILIAMNTIIFGESAFTLDHIFFLALLLV